jgi:hypothetical protein
MDEQLPWKKTCYIGDWSFLRDVTIAGIEKKLSPKRIELVTYGPFMDFLEPVMDLEEWE